MSRLANGFLIAACSVVLATGGYWLFEKLSSAQALENCIDRLSVLLAMQEIENEINLERLINYDNPSTPDNASPAPSNVNAIASTKRVEVRQLCVEKPFRTDYRY